MSVELIEKIIKEAIPMGLKEIIPSTMGEPLLYRHFDKIIALCHQYKLKLNLTTNGTFPGKSVEEWAKSIAPVCSDIKISMNASNKKIQESIMLHSDFDRMMDNLKRFIIARNDICKKMGHYCRTTLQMTFMEDNLEDLPDLVNMAIKLGIDRLKGHHLWTHFPEIKQLSLRRSQDSINRWNGMVKIVEEIVQNKPLANGKKLLLENFHILNPDQPDKLIEDGVCPFLGKEAWINWEGRFDPCCAPDEQRKSLGYFGTVKDSSLANIWNGRQYKSLLNNYDNHPLCQSCNMKKQLEA